MLLQDVQVGTSTTPRPRYLEIPNNENLHVILFVPPTEESCRESTESVENIQAEVTRFLRGIPVEEFQSAFQAWQNRLRRCIGAGENYTN
ncbi:hypothetical protein J6590_051988 [Homalodisca vitripennis]|nr:hypothetical protein J6590_051988 [Homalodisca vitripennis]